MQEIKNENLSSVEAVEATAAAANTKDIAVLLLKFLVLLSIAIFAPAFNVQAVTGTLVNAVLFIAAATLGAPAAILIGFLPSAISAATGALVPALEGMVPFIILSNALLVLSFSALGKNSYWKGAVLASFVKFAFLSIVSTFLIGYFVSEAAASKLAVMMSYPQLYTALSGALLAYAVLGMMKKIER